MKYPQDTANDRATQWCEPSPHLMQMTDEEIERELCDDVRRAGRYMDALNSLGAAAGLPVSPGSFSYATGREAVE